MQVHSEYQIERMRYMVAKINFIYYTSTVNAGWLATKEYHFNGDDSICAMQYRKDGYEALVAGIIFKK